ncbi:hypothetical protein EON73_03095, partial [bacterium]
MEIFKKTVNTQALVSKMPKVKSKEQKVMILPPLQTYMVQPNRVTFTLFDDFTMLQMKAFVAIMLNLQEAIKLN